MYRRIHENDDVFFLQRSTNVSVTCIHLCRRLPALPLASVIKLMSMVMGGSWPTSNFGFSNNDENANNGFITKKSMPCQNFNQINDGIIYTKLQAARYVWYHFHV